MSRAVTELLANTPQIDLDHIRYYYRGRSNSSPVVYTADNEFWRKRETDAFNTWAAMAEAGRSYMAGTPMPEYLESHTSRLSDWQRLAYRWCAANTERTLVIKAPRFEWEVSWRGEFCEFGLPHQDHGGEKHWVSRDGRTKLWVNND